MNFMAFGYWAANDIASFTAATALTAIGWGFGYLVGRRIVWFRNRRRVLRWLRAEGAWKRSQVRKWLAAERAWKLRKLDDAIERNPWRIPRQSNR